MGTVRSELAFPLENRGESRAAVARGVEEAALALGIAHLLERSTHELSGGELQRVALGAALAGRPRLVLLDEPTSQLDPVAGDELIGLLRRLNEEWGTTVVLAEHRLERCLTAADRVLALDGRRPPLRRRAAGLPRLGRGVRARAADPRRRPARPRRPPPAAGRRQSRPRHPPRRRRPRPGPDPRRAGPSSPACKKSALPPTRGAAPARRFAPRAPPRCGKSADATAALRGAATSGPSRRRRADDPARRRADAASRASGSR